MEGPREKTGPVPLDDRWRGLLHPEFGMARGSKN